LLIIIADELSQLVRTFEPVIAENRATLCGAESHHNKL